MSLSRRLLQPVASLAGRHAAAQYRSFVSAAMNGRKTQDALLADLISRHADTKFGRDHGLQAVGDWRDFRNAVPVRDYSRLAPYLEAVYQGDLQALLPKDEQVLLFALTSGTTGEPKRIPVTRRSLNHYRRGWNIFGWKMLADHRDAWLRDILQISSPAVEYHSPAGVPCGAISGLLAQTQKAIVRRMYVAPQSITEISDPMARYYTLLRLAMPRDVGWISTANPSSVVKLLAMAQAYAQDLLRDLRDGTLNPPGGLPEVMREGLRLRKHPRLVRAIEAGMARDGELRCEHFWNLAICLHWTGGPLKLYLPDVKRLTNNSPIRDIGLLASEGRFSIPMQDGTPSGVADVQGAFLEFVPPEQIDKEQPETLRSHEVEIGREYFLLLTNYAGLWRYDIHDRVRVTGMHGDTPLIEFLSKGDHITSMTGEKLSEDQVVHAVDQASAEVNLHVRRFWAQPCFDRTPFYRFTLEGAAPPDGTVERWAKALDAALQEQNIEYAGKRHGGRLAEPRVCFAPSEVFARHEQKTLTGREGRSEQYKHKYLITDVLDVRIGPGHPSEDSATSQ